MKEASAVAAPRRRLEVGERSRLDADSQTALVEVDGREGGTDRPRVQHRPPHVAAGVDAGDYEVGRRAVRSEAAGDDDEAGKRLDGEGLGVLEARQRHRRDLDAVTHGVQRTYPGPCAARLGGWCGHDDVTATVAESPREAGEAWRVDSVVVRDQDPHLTTIPRSVADLRDRLRHATTVGGAVRALLRIGSCMRR